MTELPDHLHPHAPGPLGAHVVPGGIAFCVFAEAAERVELCVFDATGTTELKRLEMPECTDGLWHGLLPGAGAGLVYGYRVHGPYLPAAGQRFNGHKLLLDPYARELRGALVWDDALYAYTVGGDDETRPDARDSAPFLPKAVVVDEAFDWQGDAPPRVPWNETVIYEMHVKGFSQCCEALPSAVRGSFGALGHPFVLDYFKRLGVTTIELMPVHAFARDRRLVELELTNYWGYNTLAFFAPDPAYLSQGSRDELKWAIRELHRAGIEVILDVVYNHSCEGDALGPSLSWRGFGNAEYYWLTEGEPRHHVNDTGCGNTFDFRHPRVIQMTMDSLRYWVEAYHVDGFRFDLSVTLGRETEGFSTGAGFYDALMQDPCLSQVKLIAEPWDIGMGGYQVGQHPAGMAEWNGPYRDDLRRYWKGDAGLRAALAERLQGSAGMFDHHRRRPWASVNFIIAHDGFTLEDLVSYNEKHNEANGEDGRDGSSDNQSCNWGFEGATDEAGIVTQRDKIKRALMTCLVFSQGTPMFLAGDEFGQTQHGNNNAYCQDSAISWLDWSLPESPRGAAQLAFTRRLLQLRGLHPALRSTHYQHGQVELAPGLPDVSWFDERGVALGDEDWANPSGRLLGLRRAVRRADGRIEVLLLLISADGDAHEFLLPKHETTPCFRVLVDTHEPDLIDVPVAEGRYTLRGHSVALLIAEHAV